MTQKNLFRCEDSPLPRRKWKPRSRLYRWALTWRLLGRLLLPVGLYWVMEHDRILLVEGDEIIALYEPGMKHILFY